MSSRNGTATAFFADGVVDVFVDVETFEGREGLAGVDEGTSEQVLGDGHGIGVGQHDTGVVAGELQGLTVSAEDLMKHPGFHGSVHPDWE